jgi:hypothetical protein
MLTYATGAASGANVVLETELGKLKHGWPIQVSAIFFSFFLLFISICS